MAKINIFDTFLLKFFKMSLNNLEELKKKF